MKRVWVLPGILLLIAAGLTPFLWPTAEAQSKLQANAGEDHEVYTNNPDIFSGNGYLSYLNGCDSTGDIVKYEWFNQWGQLRALSPETPYDGVCGGELGVNFGKNAKLGATRTFTLVLTADDGQTSKDTVTLTLADPPPADPLGDPADDHPFLAGNTWWYSLWGYGGPSYNFTTGILDTDSEHDHWYISSWTAGEDIYGTPAPITCHFGVFWEVFDEPNFKDSEGCFGPVNQETFGGGSLDELEFFVLTSADGGWAIVSSAGYVLATVEPVSRDQLYQFLGTEPVD
jgi:hypothetical protein